MAREWNVWLAIYLSDERYAQTRWNIIKGSEERKPRKILTLKLTQGQIVNRDIDGHYDSMKPKKGVLWGRVPSWNHENNKNNEYEIIW